MKRLTTALLLAFLGSTVALSACGKKESITPIGDGKKLTAEEIDKDPIALLPGGPVGFVSVDAKAFFNSNAGPEAVKAASAYVPLTPEMNFDPKRDVSTFVAGVYSTSGADFAGIAQGKFDVAAIKAAVAKGVKTEKGAPITKVEYAGYDLYVAGDVGFVLLTEKSLLTGSPAGLRRTLERMRDGRVKREIPDAMLEFAKTPGAQLAVIINPEGQSVSQAVLSTAPFLKGMRQAKVLGTFEPEGMRTAGQITYPDEASAKTADEQVKSMHGSTINVLAGLAGMSPVKSLETKVSGENLQFAALVNGPVVIRLLVWAREAAAEHTKAPQ